MANIFSIFPILVFFPICLLWSGKLGTRLQVQIWWGGRGKEEEGTKHRASLVD